MYKDEQDVPVRQRTNASEEFAVKRVKVVSEDFGQKKTTRKHRSKSKFNESEMPADISVKQPN